jgi:hypothetical protein
LAESIIDSLQNLQDSQGLTRYNITHIFRQPEKFIKAADLVFDNEWLKKEETGLEKLDASDQKGFPLTGT